MPTKKTPTGTSLTELRRSTAAGHHDPRPRRRGGAESEGRRCPALARFTAGRPVDQVIVPVDAPKPTLRKGQQRFNLRPGVADADAVELYAYGYCAHLAAAIHEATGWPFDLVEFQDGDRWVWNHVGVHAPDGRFIDIHGVRDPRVVVHLHANEKHRKVRIRQIGSTCGLLTVFGVVDPEWPDSWWADELDPLMADVTRYFAYQLIAQTAPHPRVEDQRNL